VSIVKGRACVRLGGRQGPVRTPLTDLDQSEMDALVKLVAGRA